tara:strand:- start:9266 stop:9775 length:510 start_codon:yes stop_codon:yes gene_type:complete
MTDWKTEFYSFFETILGSPYGTKPFWITAGIALGTLFILGWLIANFIFAAKRGILLTFIAQLLPIAAAAAGWVAVSIYAIPDLNAGFIRDYLPLAGAILAGFITAMIATRFFLGVSEGKSFFCVVASYACVAGAIYFGGTVVTQVDSGLEGLEMQQQEHEKETNSILDY